MSEPSKNTRWSLVQQAQGDTPVARAALAELCAIYHAPVYAFVKHWCHDANATDDLTQAFFARVLDGGALNGADAQRGRFRAYLIGAVKHFIAGQHRDAAALKRGGAVHHVCETEARDLADPRALPPDVEFDRAWACAVLDRTLAQLRAELDRDGKAKVFDLLKSWLAGTASHGETTGAASQLGVSETAVRVLLSRLRKRMRELLRTELAQTLANDADVDAELQHLAAALRR
jgi:RNA polymerase sigma-70 factor (ECF subfamily)